MTVDVNYTVHKAEELINTEMKRTIAQHCFNISDESINKINEIFQRTNLDTKVLMDKLVSNLSLEYGFSYEVSYFCTYDNHKYQLLYLKFIYRGEYL